MAASSDPSPGACSPRGSGCPPIRPPRPSRSAGSPTLAAATSIIGISRSSANGDQAARTSSAAPAIICSNGSPLLFSEADVRDRRGREAEDRDDHELREDDRDEQLDQPPRPAARRGPDHRDERERQEEDADVDRRVADDHLEPEHERADREDDRAEEDAEQRDRRSSRRARSCRRRRRTAAGCRTRSCRGCCTTACERSSVIAISRPVAAIATPARMNAIGR